jgi:hypothetical protein
MSTFITKIFILCLGISVAGCAHMPSVTATYYFPKAETTIIATQTLACTAPKDSAGKPIQQDLTVVQTLVPTTAYLRDDGVSPKQFSYKDSSGDLWDTDIAVSWNNFGGLAGLNSTIQGEGGTIVKNVVSLVGAVTGGAFMFAAKSHLDLLDNAEERKKHDVKPVCDLIAKYSAPASPDSSKIPTLTLVYSAAFDYFARNEKPIPLSASMATAPNLVITSADVRSLRPVKDDPNYVVIPADPDSETLLRQLPEDLRNRLHYRMKVTAASTTRRLASATNESAESSSSDPRVWINDQADVTLDFKGPVAHKDGTLIVSDLLNSHVAVPLRSGYSLPVPKGVIFGKLVASIALDNTGALTKLEYSQTSGAADANAAAASVISALNPTASQQASYLQSQADLIYQQQRLASCLANQTTCSGK